MGSDDVALREELESLERTIAETRQMAAAVRAEVGSRSDGPGDPEDVTALLTEAEEQEAFAAVLEERRDRLRQRLGLDAV
jgi:hypothetical protein